MPITSAIQYANNRQDTIEYDDEPLAQGGEGVIYTSTDKKFVIKIFHESLHKSIDVLTRILGACPPSGSEFGKVLAWPTAIVLDPTHRRAIGVVMPNVQVNGWMEKLIWYRSKKTLGMLYAERPTHFGTFSGRVEAAIDITKAATYLNRIGYSHADFSGNNIFVNTVDGRAIVIDLDGLIVPKYIRGEILGTPGYMAPELVTKEQTEPNKYSDRHALAVVLYEFLLMGHPLKGGRAPLSEDPEKDDELMFGRHALYREHSTDKSNRPLKQFYSANILGDEMAGLFRRSFETNIAYQNQRGRPHPDEYEDALKRLWADLVKCTNKTCWWGYFPSWDGTAETCPCCRMRSIEVVRGYAKVMPAHPKHGLFSFHGAKSHKLVRDCILSAGQIFGEGKEMPVIQIKPTLHENIWEIVVLSRDVQTAVIPSNSGFIQPLEYGKTQKVGAENWLRLVNAKTNSQPVLLQFGRKQIDRW